MILQYFKWNDFDQFWTIAVGATGMLGMLLVVAQLFYVMVQVRRARRQFELSQAGETSRIFSEVMDRWADQYENRCALMAKPATTADALLEKHGKNPSNLLSDPTWQNEIRPMLNFYEFLGVLLSNEKLDRDEILERVFTLVTVDSYPGRSLKKADGILYQHFEPYLTYLRSPDYSGYRDDIYEYYDDVLIPQYIEYQREKRRKKCEQRRA